VEPHRPMSVMSSLSYRKHPNLKDSLSGKGDDSSLFSALKENGETQKPLTSFPKSKPRTADQDDSYSVSSWRKPHAGDDMAYSEAASRARKGMDSRWGDFDKESTAPSRAYSVRGYSLDDDGKSSQVHSSLGRRGSLSQVGNGTAGESLYGARSPSSPCLSRRSGVRSPGNLSRADSRFSAARSCRLSEFDVDADDRRSVAFTERSAYSPHSSTGRSVSMPPQARSSLGGDDDPLDTCDVKPVSHRNYLDPDLEKAINEVLSFKPIKFKRTSLEDSEAEATKTPAGGEKKEEEEDNDGKRSRSRAEKKKSSSSGSSSSLRRSASAVDCMRTSSRMSSRSSRSSSKSKGKSKKKKRSHSSESGSSADDRHSRSSSKKRGKKSKKKSKSKRGRSSSSSSSSSSNSKSDSESDSGSGASTISYRSSHSVKRAPGLRDLDGAGEDAAAPPDDDRDKTADAKSDKKRKKKVDSLMMKYLYRPDSD